MSSAKVCSVEGCEYPAPWVVKGLCPAHYARNRRNGHTERTRRANGQGTITKDGYVKITINRRMANEHVLVAEKALGKRLPAGAVVHHVNHNKTDNRPENLVICPDHAYHRLLHVREAMIGRP